MTDEEAGRAIVQAMCDTMNRAVPAAIPAIKESVGSLAERLLLDSSEALALQGGRLQGELGVIDPAKALSLLGSILRKSVEATTVTFAPAGPYGLTGGLEISLLRNGFAELSNAPFAFRTPNGQLVEWLRWLLETGDRVVVQGYSFLGGDRRGSRTGLGIMRQGGSWGVPPEAAGVKGNNFLTRALSRLPEQAIPLIKAALEAAI